MDVVKRQDMPPPGGYKSIPFKRVPARSFFNGWSLIAGYLGMTAAAAYVYYLSYKKINYEEVEHRSANLALYPMLQAERDREYLKQLNRNREEEAELMKNVEGWKVGTWYGEPIYQTTDRDVYDLKSLDYFVHSSIKDFKKRMYITLMS